MPSEPLIQWRPFWQVRVAKRFLCCLISAEAYETNHDCCCSVPACDLGGLPANGSSARTVPKCSFRLLFSFLVANVRSNSHHSSRLESGDRAIPKATSN